MPQVTSVEPQKKRKDRLNIFLDGAYAFSLDTPTVLKNNIKTGKQLSQKEIQVLLKENETAKLVDLALNYLSFRPRSQKEIQDYLVKKIAQRENIKFAKAKESKLIGKCIEKLTKYKYIDDVEFAKWWTESRSKANPKGARLIKLELLRKGIDKDVIDEILEKNLNQKELAYKAIQKKLKSWQQLPKVEFKNKAYRYLASRGFEFDEIRQTVAQLEQKS
ncbi:hypothetical protein A3A49_02990 [Candidatus Curtissbacteria bacterium RIFCSPLOWO2_01_FULL_38_11b]|uniref:Regulatory protein RecX n=1 Tax=Candidatus Curtissbacteria bacterium RIFCSPLOWO2_01_FULL_38_11b TaxID=1797725 RepID=A0A1F5H047_9BACT|nr:MAG: hypothetical protein A3A49_02990 [Candidatus Curtissbacteria bacterium RIFCSPLOWO2_01_FULL_38_11b]